ncbi:tetratricopeptide repeat protein [Streptomyces sp. UNOC14_S4]|uniref:tetratricopeptide repeat protein n=1 Tax=Streptomyces sp. UNOC14_S4 TaxID=2872340 RepID=UPI001E596529|nr:tetratricopeptide repeat protein [Streptomyces sp. UNOC14_S4]MCC3769736.1 tetratricopeptide repeat protein [Streptomyces sp. UNOC14_S4]
MNTESHFNEIRDGVFFHAVIQGRNITMQLPRQIKPALWGLPRKSATFTGRDEDVQILLRLLSPDGDQSPLPVAVVSGMAGIGKTELAVQTAAHILEKTDWFSGGALFINLHGYDNSRSVAPDQALAGFLRSLGLSGEQIPDTLEDRSRLYRSILSSYASHGQKVLVVIDNASTTEQADSLLPGDGAGGVLITSRHFLDVGARLHELGVLDQTASVELMDNVLRRARGPEDTRLQDAPQPARQIAEACAGLPLALRIAAALLADSPTRPAASLAQALKAAQTRLDRLSREEKAVRAAFELSYQRLPVNQARIFRLLPLNPGPDLSTQATASLVNTEEHDVEATLLDLARAHLIEAGTKWGRWRMHDLIRIFADECGHSHAGRDKREDAQENLFEYYTHITQEANNFLLAEENTATSNLFSSNDHAWEWLETERANLVAATITAHTLNFPGATLRLCAALSTFLDQQRYFDDLIAVTRSTLSVFQNASDHKNESAALCNLGNALTRAGRFEEAISAHSQSLAISQELGDSHGEGISLLNLGTTLTSIGQPEEAVDILRRSLKICQGTDNANYIGAALASLGNSLIEAEQPSEAADALRQAIAILRELDRQHDVGKALNSLGIALRDMGQLDEAIGLHTEAGNIFRLFRDLHAEGATLGNLGIVFLEMGQFEEAARLHNRDVEICRDLEDAYGEALALRNLGTALLRAGRLEEAVNSYSQAAIIFGKLNLPDHQVTTLNDRATARDKILQRWKEKPRDGARGK